MSAIFISFLAGVFTTLNPCVLPMLPIVMASSLEESRHGPLALAGGLIVSFTTLGLLVSAAGFALGLDSQTLRYAAAGMMIVAGVFLFSSSLQMRLATALGPMAGRADMMISESGSLGLKGQFITGLLLGAVWAPCSGPALGAAVSLAAESGGVLPAGIRLLAYGIGAGSILALLAYGSRAAIARRKESFAKLSRYAKPVMGLVFVGLGLGIIFGLDKQLEIALIKIMPDWLANFTTQF